ncbi:Sucrase/ferredoxin-like-domain-containing protein [Elsinoe ampelina]|uniref:Altered inheritance of mitochondria protein 32 n=1 Tax=Elsinoe ampelina TaxID=302913 RepID=A0A6A6FZD1_9PEZI|nr:Sucrase/ferredoxin-like-domain-containing protein [Elsinoe ampelina]
MFIFKHGCRRSAICPLRPRISAFPRREASRISIPTPPPFPVVDSCPNPTCQCQETPAGLEIDQDAPLNGTTAAYAEQVLISTGKTDWKSRIEDDEDAVLVKQLKKFLGRGGKYSDPFHNVMITNSSLPPTVNRNEAFEDRSNPIDSPNPKPGLDADRVPEQTPPSPPASAFLLPSFEYVPSIPTDDSGVEAFLRAFVLPAQIHAQHDRLSRDQRNMLQRLPELRGRFTGARKMDEILILVCGHGGRDQRCGIMGPVLCREFEDKLARQGVSVLQNAPPLVGEERNAEIDGYTPTARIGSISHIGGHKYAGNVIIYIPPSFKDHALRGKGIWYGRVEPRHVEGIVEKTVLGGKVIRDLFRGGVGEGGEALRL